MQPSTRNPDHELLRKAFLATGIKSPVSSSCFLTSHSHERRRDRLSGRTDVGMPAKGFGGTGKHLYGLSPEGTCTCFFFFPDFPSASKDASKSFGRDVCLQQLRGVHWDSWQKPTQQMNLGQVRPIILSPETATVRYGQTAARRQERVLL